MNLFVIAAGGALGSVARYLLSAVILRVSGPSFPLGTFVVNVIGCGVFGAIAGAATGRLSLSPELRLFLLTGVLGGFTTFSSFAFESVALVRAGQMAAAATNIAGQVVLGIVALGFAYAVTANQ